MSTDSVRFRSTDSPPAPQQTGAGGGLVDNGYPLSENASLDAKLRVDNKFDVGANSLPESIGEGFVVVRELLEDGFIRLTLPWCNASILQAPLTPNPQTPLERDWIEKQGDRGPDCC
jgi:hypothetical protein